MAAASLDGVPTAGTVRREKVCIMEIWCECFGKERQNLKRTDSYEVESILMKIGGWEPIQDSKAEKLAFPFMARRRHSCDARNRQTNLGNVPLYLWETLGTKDGNGRKAFKFKRLAIACSYVPKKNHIEDKR